MSELCVQHIVLSGYRYSSCIAVVIYSEIHYHCKKCPVLPSSAHGKLVLAPHWYNMENHCYSLPCMVKQQ